MVDWKTSVNLGVLVAVAVAVAGFQMGRAPEHLYYVSVGSLFCTTVFRDV